MHLVFALPDAIETGAGGGAHYVAGLTQALRAMDHRVAVLTGPEPNFPADAIPVVDGMLLPRLQHRLDELEARRSVVLVHHVAAAAGRQEGERSRVLAIEARMLPRLRVVATSQPVAARLAAEFGITGKIVPPGASALPRTEPKPEDPIILAVGVLTRRKGHDLLLRAAARLTDLRWRLVIAGDASREPQHAAELAALIDELGLADRAALLAGPDPAALEYAWRHATVFALATRWEGYPAAVAEALRRGIPVVVSDGSAAADIMPQSAGAIVPADDMATFGKCLRRLLFGDSLRSDMADAAWKAGQLLPGWPARAHDFVASLET